MLLIVVGVLGLVVLGMIVIVLMDVHRKGWRNWIDTVHAWQELLGGFTGLIAAAGVFVLGISLSDMADQQRADKASRAIGSALAYETERMIVALQASKEGVEEIDLASPTAASDCMEYAEIMRVSMARDTPVFDAGLERLVEFGDNNLSLFVRFYAYYDEFAAIVNRVDEASCRDETEYVVDYFKLQLGLGIDYYNMIASQYDIAKFDGQ